MHACLSHQAAAGEGYRCVGRAGLSSLMRDEAGLSEALRRVLEGFFADIDAEEPY